MMMRRQDGALLLMVSLLLATLAALAFGMNRAGSVELRSVNDDYEGRAAAYLAESGVAVARWSNQVSGCTVNPVPVTALGIGTFSATVGGKSDKLDIVASGSVNGAARTVSRPKVTLYDLTETESTDLTDDVVDTTIAMLGIFQENEFTTMNLTAGMANGLMSWDLDDLDDDVVVLSATLTLTQNGSGAARQVAIHRVTTPWDKNAMWGRPRGTGTWRTNGGDYTGVALAKASVAAGNGVWDLTGMVDGWASKRFTNQGVLLRVVEGSLPVSFHSSEASSSSRRPLLRVVTAEKC